MTVSNQSASLPLAIPLTRPNIGLGVEKLSRYLVLFSVALVLVWIGLTKSTGFGTAAIEPIVANSTFLFWLYDILSIHGVSNPIGVIEIATAVLLATRPWSAGAGVIGGALVVATFITTLAMIFTLPSWEPNLGFPVLSAMPGQFLIKDVLFLGAAVWCLGAALKGLDAEQGDSGEVRQ